MATLWQVENQSRGIHTKPARIEGGEGYAADIENLMIDENGFLKLRSGVETVGLQRGFLSWGLNDEVFVFNNHTIGLDAPAPDYSEITGIAQTTDYLFLLRNNGRLFWRALADLDTETEIEGVENLEGRISVVQPFGTYLILTSEGTDQGYWIDLREDSFGEAFPLGIEAPIAGAFALISGVPPLDTEYSALVFYAISYVRQFTAEVGEVQPDELFNGMESDISPLQYMFTRQYDIENTENSPQRRFPNEDASGGHGRWDFSAPNSPVGAGEMTREGNRVLINFTDKDGMSHETLMRDAVFRFGNSQIQLIDASSSDTLFGAKVDTATIESSHLRLTVTDIAANVGIGLGDEVIPEFFSAAIAEGFMLAVDSYYPALFTGFDLFTDPQVTHIKLYRSRLFRQGTDEYDDIKTLVEDSEADLDFDLLNFRLVHTVANPDIYDIPIFIDGVNVTEETDADSNTITVYTPYLHVLREDSKEYVWSEQPAYTQFQNKRLPPEAMAIHYNRGRIFAPAGDRLVFSRFDGTIQALWAFPPKNEIRRPRPGRVDFVGGYRLDTYGESSGILLYGAKDGIFRLTGDVTDFETTLLPNVTNVEVGAEGPIDAYAWGVLRDRFGFVAPRGLYLTDGVQVELVSDEALDGFFDNREIIKGGVTFFDDNTILFAAQLKPIRGGGDTEDAIFVLDDRHWVRWTGETVDQFAGFYIAGDGELRRVAWREGENTDTELAWAYESNLIHGQEAGAGTVWKRFRELYLQSSADVEMTLKTWVDGQETPTEKDFTSRDDPYYQRVPVERQGRRLRFRLEGTGPVEVRGLMIEGDVEARV